MALRLFINIVHHRLRPHKLRQRIE